MKRLYLLRHAQSLSTSPGSKDYERELSPQGIEDASHLGQAMADKSYSPDCAIYSPAARTKTTLECLSLTNIKTLSEESMYETGSEGLMDIIADCDDGYDSLLLVGHNPAMHELAMRLSSEESPVSFLQRLMQGYHPGTLSVLDCPCMFWNDLELGANVLVDLLSPMDYNAPSRPTRWM